jgi:hypothetical protein
MTRGVGPSMRSTRDQAGRIGAQLPVRAASAHSPGLVNLATGVALESYQAETEA